MLHYTSIDAWLEALIINIHHLLSAALLHAFHLLSDTLPITFDAKTLLAALPLGRCSCYKAYAGEAAVDGLYVVQIDYGQLEYDNMAERSKAVRSGRIPKGREFESHCCHQPLFLPSPGWMHFVLHVRHLQCWVFSRPWLREVGEQCGVYKGFSLHSG